MMRYKKVKIAMIEWEDATMIGKEQMASDDPSIKLMQGFSAGIIVHEDKEKIALCLDFFADDHPYTEPFRVVNVYPKSGIKKIHRLKEYEVTPVATPKERDE